MPTIFFGHGNPLNSLSKNIYTEDWASIGKSIPRPKAAALSAVALCARSSPEKGKGQFSGARG